MIKIEFVNKTLEELKIIADRLDNYPHSKKSEVTMGAEVPFSELKSTTYLNCKEPLYAFIWGIKKGKPWGVLTVYSSRLNQDLSDLVSN